LESNKAAAKSRVSNRLDFGYGREDLLVLAYVAKEAFRYIVSQPTK
jgi:hypothetical protein